MKTREELCARIDAGERFKYLLFWGHTPKGPGVGKHVLSQWWEQTFHEDGVAYASAEHYMMAGKARLFGDDEMLTEILEADSPGAAKAFGRKVRGFDTDRWNQHRFDIVVRGNVAKFSEHEDLRTYLLETGTKVLVEASPRDRIWGIGMGASNPDAENPSRWRGSNLLGFALMTARTRLGA